MNGYVDTTLIDCNRLASEEAKGGNNASPAQFTNKIGNGLRINPGDKISVESSFVSERGCGGQVIEFDGKVIPNGEYELISTEITTSDPPRYQYIDKGLVGADTTIHDPQSVPPTPFGDIGPFNDHRVAHTNIKRKYTLKDNEVNFQISYYKNTNGQGYFHLPRRFDAIYQPGDAAHWTNDPDDIPIINVPGQPYSDQYKNLGDKPGASVEQQDNFLNGRTSCSPNPTSRCPADWSLYSWGAHFGTSAPYEAQPEAGAWDDNSQVPPAAYTALQQDNPIRNKRPGWNTGMMWKQKNDGSRYTIYAKDVCFYSAHIGDLQIGGDPPEAIIEGPSAFEWDDNDPTGEDTGGVPVIQDASRDDFFVDGTGGGWVSNALREPAMSGYTRYYEVKTISVPAGHNAPSNVAETITNELGEITDERTIYGWSGTWVGPYDGTRNGAFCPQVDWILGETGADERPAYKTLNTTQKQIPVSKKSNSQTFKAFACANFKSFGKTQWEDYQGEKNVVAGTTTMDAVGRDNGSQNVIDWVSSHQYIGVKRPELWDAMREFYFDQVSGESGTAYSYRNLDNPQVFHGAAMGATHRPDVGFTYQANSGPIVTDMEWTDENLLKWKKVFDAQALYPDLFNDYEWTNVEARGSLYKKADGGKGCSPDYMRFLHMNTWSGLVAPSGINGVSTNTRMGLGCDNMYQAEGLDENIRIPAEESTPLFIHYDSSRKDDPTEQGEMHRAYGLFFKYRSNEIASGEYKDYISFSTYFIGGIPNHHFTLKGVGDPEFGTDDFCINNATINISFDAAGGRGRGIGFDLHFNAYGTSCIGLYSGYLGSDKENLEVYSSEQMGITGKSADGTKTYKTYPHLNVSQFIRHRYIGSNTPLLAFDDKGERFNLQQLHSATVIENPPGAGGGSSSDDKVGNVEAVATAGNSVIYINRRLLGNEYCPDMFPYAPELEDSERKTDKGVGAAITRQNNNIYPWSVMDADSGIFIEDFGISQTSWDKSLWGVLGFSYTQFHNALSYDRQTRINNIVSTENIAAITTNGNLSPSSVLQYRTNLYGNPVYTSQMGCPVAAKNAQFVHPEKKVDTINNAGSGILPEIVIDATSAQISAEKLPRKMLKPYYLIRSNIVGDLAYLGGVDSGQSLPIVAVVNKENGFGDFYFAQNDKLVFTATIPRVITEISTSIHDPDMELANVGEDSAVIYKVEKTNMANLNVVQDVLNANKKKSTKK
jgi:hypothetical protein